MTREQQQVAILRLAVIALAALNAETLDHLGHPMLGWLLTGVCGWQFYKLFQGE